MEIFFQNGYAASQATAYGLLYYMTGTPPASPSEVKMKVDLSDMSDLHAKSVGCALVKSNTVQDATTGVYSNTYTPYGGGTQYSWLRGGQVPMTTAVGATTYFINCPSKAYYYNGRKSTLYSMPPFLFAMPANIISNAATFNIHTAVNTRSDVTVTNNTAIQFVVEYEQAITLDAYSIYQGNTVNTNDYINSINVQVWNGSGWAPTQNNNNAAAATASAHTIATCYYHVTGTKFLVSLGVSANTKGWYGFNLNSVALLSYAQTATTVALPDITWGVIVPYNTLTGQVANNQDIYSSSNYNINLNAIPTVDVTQNPSAARTSNYYGNLTTNVPAIIDTCGQDSTTNKMVLNQSTGLDSTKHPTLQGYRYVLGDIS